MGCIVSERVYSEHNQRISYKVRWGLLERSDVEHTHHSLTGRFKIVRPHSDLSKFSSNPNLVLLQHV